MSDSTAPVASAVAALHLNDIAPAVETRGAGEEKVSVYQRLNVAINTNFSNLTA